MGPAETELEHRVTARGEADAGGLGRDEGLEVDHVQERGLQQLGLEDGTLYADEGLVGEDDRALRDGIDVAREAQRLQVVQEDGVEEGPTIAAVERREVGHVLGGKAEVGQEVHDSGQAAGDREAASEGVLPEEEVEDRPLCRRPRLPVGVGHRELIEVGQRRQRRTVELGKPCHFTSRGRGYQ